MFGLPFFPFLWPSQCWVCDSWPITDGVCRECYLRFCFQGQRCMGCALALPAVLRTQTPVQEQAQKHAQVQTLSGIEEETKGLTLCVRCLQQDRLAPLQRCAAAVDYAYPWSQLLSAYKLRQHIGLARVLARVMLQTPEVVSLLQDCDYLIPVPLSAERLYTRGFNQSLQLAYALCSYSVCRGKVLPYALQRVRDTSTQGGLTATQRVGNVHNAFALSVQLPAAWYEKKLLLVDDVMTTGASLTACARALVPLAPTALTAMVCMRTPAGV